MGALRVRRREHRDCDERGASPPKVARKKEVNDDLRTILTGVCLDSEVHCAVTTAGLYLGFFVQEGRHN